MRKITELTAQAVVNKENFELSNTKVVTERGISKVYLHNNLIAKYNHSRDKLSITHAGWKTNTTKERLNGVIKTIRSGRDGVYQNKGVWYLKTNNDTISIDNEKWFSL